MKPISHFASSFPPILAAGSVKAPATPQPAQSLDDQYARAVFPSINQACFKTTMDNFRSFRQGYNDRVITLNASIRKANKKVRSNSKINPPDRTKQVLIDTFYKKWNDSTATSYNTAASSFNDIHGHYIPLQTYPKLSDTSIVIFEAILHAYAVQLNKRVSVFKSIDKTAKTTIPKVEIHPFEIINQKRGQEVYNLSVCTRTIRRYCKRFLAAGILQQYQYRGSEKPVQYHINPEILAVFDLSDVKSQKPVKQRFNPTQRTNCPHNEDSTRTVWNDTEIKGNVNNSHSDIGNNASHLSNNEIFYRTTEPQDAKNQKSKPAPKKLDPAPEQMPLPAAAVAAKKNSPALDHVTNAINDLEPPSELAQNLSRGMYNYHSPIDISILRDQVIRNDVSDNDFRDLCLYDFIRSAAVIRKDHQQSSPGSWRIAIRHIDSDFGCINFKGNAADKSAVLERLVEFRYRLRRAISWFEKNKSFNPLYANQYFDPTRTLPSQVGWNYTKKFWTKELKRRSKIAADKRRGIARTIEEKKRLSQDRKDRKNLDSQIYRYLRNEINYNQLTGYVARQPKKLQNLFPKRLELLNKRRLTKK